MFRLTVWNDKKREADMIDFAAISEGADIRADQVTGLHLSKEKLAQGNTSHAEVVSEDAIALRDGQNGKKTTKRQKRSTQRCAELKIDEVNARLQ